MKKIVMLVVAVAFAFALTANAAETVKVTETQKGDVTTVKAVEKAPGQKETLKATYSAAEAQTKIGEAFAGLSSELGDVGIAVQRAEDKTAQMQARAAAIDELVASGALEDPSGMGKDALTLELERMASDPDAVRTAAGDV